MSITRIYRRMVHDYGNTSSATVPLTMLVKLREKLISQKCRGAGRHWEDGEHSESETESKHRLAPVASRRQPIRLLSRPFTVGLTPARTTGTELRTLVATSRKQKQMRRMTRRGSSPTARV